MTAQQATETYLSPEEVCALIPGMTKGNLAQLRYAGGGPIFAKPSRKTVVYLRSDVDAWIRSRRHERTDKPLAPAPA